MLNGDPLLLSHGGDRRPGSKPPGHYAKTRFFTAGNCVARHIPFRPPHGTRFARPIPYEGYAYFTTIGVPLFMHQYAHAWIDYRDCREQEATELIILKTLLRNPRSSCFLLETHAIPGFPIQRVGYNGFGQRQRHLAGVARRVTPEIDGTVVPSAARRIANVHTGDFSRQLCVRHARQVWRADIRSIGFV